MRHHEDVARARCKYKRSEDFWARVSANAFLASAYREIVSGAWHRLHKTRAMIAEARSHGEATIVLTRLAERQERDLRILLMVRKLARHDMKGEIE